jgi:hypothetical protein
VSSSKLTKAQRKALHTFFGVRDVGMHFTGISLTPAASSFKEEEVMTNSHVGLRAYRLKDNPEEKRIAKAWQEKNGNLLAHILDERPNQGGNPPEPSKRDRVVAATVIQWLGTSVGQGFLEDLGYKKQ